MEGSGCARQTLLPCNRHYANMHEESAVEHSTALPRFTRSRELFPGQCSRNRFANTLSHGSLTEKSEQQAEHYRPQLGSQPHSILRLARGIAKQQNGIPPTKQVCKSPYLLLTSGDIFLFTDCNLPCFFFFFFSAHLSWTLKEAGMAQASTIKPVVFSQPMSKISKEKEP